MHIQATDRTIAVILEPVEARQLLERLDKSDPVGPKSNAARLITTMDRLTNELARFVDGEPRFLTVADAKEVAAQRER